MERTFWSELWVARAAILNGAIATTEVAVAAILIGTVIGALFGLVLVYGWRPVRWMVRIYVDVMRGIPVLVLILFLYYGLALFKINVPAMGAGIMALGGFCAAHMAETIRGAISSVPAGQTEAAKAIGLTFVQRLAHVVLPQAARRTVPPWINTAVEMVKATTLMSIIGVIELLLATQQTVARNYMIIQFYMFATVIYGTINFIISQVGAAMERRFSYLRY